MDESLLIEIRDLLKEILDLQKLTYEKQEKTMLEFGKKEAEARKYMDALLTPERIKAMFNPQKRGQ